MAECKFPHNHGNNLEKLCDHMPETEGFSVASDIFKLMGDSNRTRIFWILCHCEECVLNLSCMVDMSSPAISHHLKLLKASGLITSRREGKEVYYKAADTNIADFLHHMIEDIVKISCPKD